MYSKEDGTPAEKLPNQIHGNTKRARYNKIMSLQQQISKSNLERILLINSVSTSSISVLTSTAGVVSSA